MRTQTHAAAGFDLKKVIGELSFALPRQGPVKDFIHQQPLHEFQKEGFEKAVWDASRMYGSFAYPPVAYFQQAYREGRLLKRELDRVFELRATPAALRQEAIARLERSVDEPLVQPPRGWVHDGVRSTWRKSHGVDLAPLVEPVFYKLLGAYLDQGIASRRFPKCQNFFQGVGQLVLKSYVPIAPLSDKKVRPLFEMPPDRVILHCLNYLVEDPSLYPRYLHELILGHPGWYAMVYQIERDPDALMETRAISVEQALAVELAIELGWMYRKAGPKFSSVRRALGDNVTWLSGAAVNEDACLPLWHEAFEWTHYSDVLRALQVQAAQPKRVTSPISSQVFFCIDDRETSLRSYLEEVDLQVQTFGTAGFFGIDFYYQGVHDSKPVKQCPLPVTPRFVVRDSPEASAKIKKPRAAHAFHLNTRSNTLVRGWLTAQVIGFWSAVKLVLSLIKPTLSQPSLSSLERIDASHPMHLYREGDEKTPEGLWVGYSIAEMADRVESVLRSTGLTRGFAEILVFFAHGSSSTNNPHFAAYDCGACSGRAGAPNSRSFAVMGNDPKVRKLLADRGIEIPTATRFIGAIHDTTRDEVQYFDTADLTESQQRTLGRLQQKMEKALALNAKERCRRFELVPLSITPVKARAEVRRRSAALFEPRPEMNHATNSVTIAGRRSLTQGLFLDRRAFLQSYDPTTDPQGKTLQGLLGALVPVCGGINLEYYFSRLDNEVFGAGTKLPHNILSLLGVANGVEGDIRTGLPSQMVEIQDPIRLLLVVEQEPEVALEALKREPALYEWISGYWMRYAAISPSTQSVCVYQNGKMVPVDLASLPEPPRAADASAVLAKSGRDHIPVHRLGGH